MCPAELEGALQALGEAQGCLCNQLAAVGQQLAAAEAQQREEEGLEEMGYFGGQPEGYPAGTRHSQQQQSQLLQANLLVQQQLLAQQQRHAVECRERLERCAGRGGNMGTGCNALSGMQQGCP